MAISRFRVRRMQKFMDIFSPDMDCKILDVGGSSETWRGTGLNNNVTLLNLTKPKHRDIDLGFKCIQGNALNLDTIDDKSFDIVFSNSVIEHVGDQNSQKRFADELRRVGKSYWVQTPNRFFPVEPHLMFPFTQFMPPKIERWIALNWPVSNYRKWGIEKKRVEKFLSDTRLLSESDLRALFPRANIYKERYAGLAKCLVAWKL